MKEKELIDFVMKSEKTEVIKGELFPNNAEYNFYLSDNVLDGDSEIFAVSVYVTETHPNLWLKSFEAGDNIYYMSPSYLNEDTLQKVLKQCK